MMQTFFSHCSDAIEKAVKDKSYGLYYSESTTPNQNVHVHDCCEIFLSLSDGNGFLIDGKVYDLCKNSLFLINNYQEHKVLPCQGQQFKRYSLHVHSKFIYDNSTDTVFLGKYFYSDNKINLIHLTQKETERLVNLFKSLANDVGYADEVYKNIRTVEILLETIKLCETHAPHPDPVQTTPLKVALEYINANFNKQLTLQDIAKNSFLSVNSLCAMFKQRLSTTVIKYLTGKRISYAKILLSQGKTVTETAFESGFNDYANFIRTFKKAVGVPPGKYREETRR